MASSENEVSLEIAPLNFPGHLDRVHSPPLEHDICSHGILDSRNYLLPRMH